MSPNQFIATGSQLYSRNWLERVGGWCEEYRLIEDVDLMLRVAIAGGRFLHIATERPLFFYRDRPLSLSKSSRDQFMEACLRNLRVAIDYWKSNSQWGIREATIVATEMLAVARHFAASHSPREAEIYAELAAIAPGAVPRGSRLFRFLAKTLGVQRAEVIARNIRRLRQKTTAGGK